MSEPISAPLTGYPPGTNVLETDLYLATDVTDIAPDHPGGLTKKYSVDQLQKFLADQFSASDKRTVALTATSNLDAAYSDGPDGDGVGATLTSNNTTGILTLDGTLVLEGFRVLVPSQTNNAHNGIYVATTVNTPGTPWVLTRAEDFDGSADGEILQGDFVAVLFGDLNARSFWFLISPDATDVGTDPIIFQKQSFVAADAWIVQGSTPALLAINTGYTSSAGVTLIDFRLPVTALVGSWVEINGEGAGLFSVTQGVGQVIKDGTFSTTVGVTGQASSINQYSSIRLRCIVANTTWLVVSATGAFTYT